MYPAALKTSPVSCVHTYVTAQEREMDPSKGPISLSLETGQSVMKRAVKSKAQRVCPNVDQSYVANRDHFLDKRKKNGNHRSNKTLTQNSNADSRRRKGRGDSR
jgi:hypothetical protein